MARMIFWRDWLAWMVLTVAIASLSVTGWLWYRDHRINQMITHPQSIVDAAIVKDSDEGRFIQAWQAARQGDTAKALEIYATLDRNASPDISALARYNMGNLYLQTALGALRDEGAMAYNEASPLLAMAKESYRQALRILPNDWDAKRNMELAQRASPDIMPGIRNEQEQEETEVLKKSTERAWPTIPGFPKGMP